MCVSLDDVTLNGQPVYVVYPATQTIFKVTDYHTQEWNFVIRKATQVFGDQSECGQVANGYVNKCNAYDFLLSEIENMVRDHSAKSSFHARERQRLANLCIGLGPVLYGEHR